MSKRAEQRLIRFDPSAAPIGERLENLRIATIELVDGMPAWSGLDVWLEAERTLGATYSRQAMTVSRPDDSVEQRINGLAPAPDLGARAQLQSSVPPIQWVRR